MNKVNPRQVPSRKDYYMGLAFWIASKSKDPSTQIGAVIIGADNTPISTGYNGPPQNIDDNLMNWDRPAKYDLIFHAEVNAIRYSRDRRLLQGATLYVTGHPCKNCMLHIVGDGIKNVVYFQPKVQTGSMLSNEENIAKSKELAKDGGVYLEQFQGNLNWMRDRLLWMENLGVFA